MSTASFRMSTLLATTLLATLAFVSGCDEDETDVSGRNSAQSCETTSECPTGMDCDQGFCGDVDAACSVQSDCLSWQECNNGACEDRCNLMGECAGEEICVRGQCVLPDDPATCMAYWEGWERNEDGECVFASTSGCSNPYPYASEEECEADTATPVSTCPENDVFGPDDYVNVSDSALRCEYGEECCCGECHPSLVCNAAAGEGFVCYATDACMIPGCPCEEASECEEGQECTAGICTTPTDCEAEQDGWFLDRGGVCAYGQTTGCENPYPYASEEACCEANEGACEPVACSAPEDCPRGEVCPAGACIPAEACDAWFEGAFLNAEGYCESGTFSGCSNPFPYPNLRACCVANESACSR